MPPYGASAVKIGEWIRRRREELGLTTTQVALKSQGAVGSSGLSRVERGERKPSAEFLLALAPVLLVEVEYLYKLAGYLPSTKAKEPERGAVSLVDATRPADKGGDPGWTDQEKQELLDFAQFLRSRRGR